MPKPWPATREITSPAAISMLANLRSLRYLLPFMRDAHTLSSAAAALGRPTSTVAYWIPRFVRVGLLVHLGDEQRAGMPMPRYRAPARQLTVAYAKIPFDSRVALLDEGRMRMLRRFFDGLDEAIEDTKAFSLAFSGSGEFGTSIEMIESDGATRARPYADGWMTFHLTSQEVLEFTGELHALLAKFADRTGPRRYIVHAGLAPDPRHRWRSANDASPL
ncbi:unannotated protein [freshwater metagenome]|uniref:Unannotated protein n=1 Tax=freshwater metagenome TaxID=449393 RepID=A0A6J7EAY7_9ZZZZ|nr:hypothetical protein [Actinomycetota bacterium]